MTEKTFRCIAVDMGAASIRIMLGSIANGRLTYEEKHRFNNEIITINGEDSLTIDADYLTFVDPPDQPYLYP